MAQSLILMAVICISGYAKEPPVIPDGLRVLIEKSQSLGLDKYPIGFWNYCNLKEHGEYFTEDEVKSWADAGFTVTQGPRFDPNDPAQKAQMLQLLNWAHAYGIKLILADPRGWAMPEQNGKMREGYAEEFRSAVADFGSHPATFGFEIGDEPQAADKETFFSCSRLQKEIAPNLHPFINLLPFLPGVLSSAGADTWPNYLDEYVRKSNSDFFCYDCYTQMMPGDSGWDSYFENLRLYREAMLRNSVPFWTTLLSVGHNGYRCPTQDDIRWQFNTAIASGAHGVLWFFWYQREQERNYRMAPVDENFDRTETYSDIRRVQKAFNRRYKDLFTRLVCTRVMFSPKEYGGGSTFKPDGLVSDIPREIPIIISEFVDIKGRRYVMIVNNSTTANPRVAVTFPGPDVHVFSLDWYGNEYEGNAYNGIGSVRTPTGLTIDHYMAPGAEAVYRVESSAEVAERTLWQDQMQKEIKN